MRIRRMFLAVVFVLLAGAPSWADRHNWEMNTLASGSSGGSVLWGFNIGGARTLHKKEEVYDLHHPHRKSVFLDLSLAGSEHENEGVRQGTVLAGFRYVFKRGSMQHRAYENAPEEYWYRLNFFAQALNGYVGHTSNGSYGIGGGLGMDVFFTEFGGLRVQGDWLGLAGSDDRNHLVRVSVGVVYRFEKENKCKCPATKP
jgi:hypothetical protein